MSALGREGACADGMERAGCYAGLGSRHQWGTRRCNKEKKDIVEALTDCATFPMLLPSDEGAILVEGET